MAKAFDFAGRIQEKRQTLCTTYDRNLPGMSALS
jgi:hypothetical protein